uniref:Uncharacterized protein n=1 Tax=viral metagenome TaxID=1070528 RepID=A0A6C0BM63_9ZZZZ
MKRQFAYTVGPGPDAGAPRCNPSGGTLAKHWRNDHIFEREGDDNIVYFTDYVEQSFLGGAAGPMPWSMSPTVPTAHNNSIVLEVKDQATTFLCEESHNVKRTMCLKPRASVKVFVDAWEHYQTVPLVVQVGAVQSAAPYRWTFFNYSPIGGSPVEGQGLAAPADLEATNLLPPIIQTLGHTNRTPAGEFPVSEATKQQTCCCAWDRPFLVIENAADSAESADLLVIVKIGQ